MEKKKLHIKTYGCQMNVYDSSRMEDIVLPLGYEITENDAEADLLILNTCHIREKASEKVFSELGRIKKKKLDKGGDMIIAVAGCVAQAQGEEIMKRSPWVNMVFGPQSYHKLPEMIAKTMRKVDGKGVLNTDFPEEIKFDHMPKPRVEGKAAFLAVQEGCDKFCTYCVVPYTRGAEYSRSTQAIMDEAQHLVDNGVMEITLLGQNVNNWHGVGKHGREENLGELIHKLAEIKDLKRIRYVTSYPSEMTQDLIDAHGNIEKLMPYLHLPIQSGSNKILKAMNRNHTVEEYLNIFESLRNVRHDIALSGDFIVGFPGESEQDFQDTLGVVKKVGYASAYSFTYSPRPGTPASVLPKQVNDQIKAERLSILQQAISESQQTFNDNLVGKTLSVLMESTGRRDGQLVGRSPYMQAVHCLMDESYMNQLVNLKIISASKFSLEGELVI